MRRCRACRPTPCALYPELQRISGQDIGLHYPGGLNVAATQERWDLLRADVARHKTLGLDTQLVGPAEIRDLCPIMDTRGVLGAIYDPMEGHLDPSGATHAFAKAARLNGAEIYRHTRVLALTPTGRGSWEVATDQGPIEAEHVVNAGGLWAREVGHMVGVELPLVPWSTITSSPRTWRSCARRRRELPVVVDLDGEMYMRQERHGVLLGVYETPATPWAVGGTPWEYGDNELLAPDLDRLTGALEKGFTRFPVLHAAGIRTDRERSVYLHAGRQPARRARARRPQLLGGVRGDGGLLPGRRGGACARHLDDQGRAGQGDAFALDVARFGDYATRAYVLEKAREFYSRRFRIAYPNEYWPAGRPSKTSALHARLAARNAVHGVSYGLEYPLYFAPAGERRPRRSRRSGARAPSVPWAAECRAARSAGGDARRELVQPVRVLRAAAPKVSLDRLLAAKLPGARPRPADADAVGRSGRLMGDLTTMRMAPDRFLVFGSGYLQAWHMRWFAAHLPATAASRCEICPTSGAASRCSGRRSREALARVTARGCQPRGLPVHDCPADGCGSLQRARRAHVGHRRAGLRDPRAAGLPRRDLRPSDGGSAGSSGRGCGDVRAPVSANREGIRDLVARILARLHADGERSCEVHRLRQAGVHRPRSGASKIAMRRPSGGLSCWTWTRHDAEANFYETDLVRR